MLKRIQAFIRGMMECRKSYSTFYRDWRVASSYDAGRRFALRLMGE